MEYFFSTKQLTVGYNGKPLIRDIEIRLEKGKILTLIGPNGSGKSTILKSITRQLKRISGTVYIDGSSIDALSARDMAQKTAVVLTEKPQTELMTCEQVVALGRYPYAGMLGILSAEDRAQVQDAMLLVSAWDLRENDFTQVSDGQRQRVLLARALCQQPEVIVLDEPTSFLDARYALELLDLLRTMAKERGITVIMSLHSLDMAQKVSDLVMCVKGENITRIGPPEQIFTRELVGELYALSGGSYNPLFGSFELARPKGEPEVFVIAGGGSGILTYRALQKKHIPFATGVLHQNDIDYQLARDLAAQVVFERSFTSISEAAFQHALSCMRACGKVINCLEAYGETNARNQELLEYALSLGLTIAASVDAL